MDDSARRGHGPRFEVKDHQRWATAEDTSTDITRRFIPDEDDPTVRASPEFTEALLGTHGGLRARPVSSTVDARSPEPKSSTQATRWDDEPSTPTSADSRWADASISIRMESLINDDPALASAIAQLRSGDRPSGVVEEPRREPPSYEFPNEDRTVVDGWANGPAPAQSRSQNRLSGTLRDPTYDEATDVEPASPKQWLPKPARVPAEFARTKPPAARRGPAPEKGPALRVVKVVIAGALLTGLSFFAGRMNYDPAFRTRVTSTVTPLWRSAASGFAELAQRVRTRPAKNTAPPPRLPATVTAPRVSTLAAKPAAPDGPTEPALRVYQIEELPLDACDGPRCDDDGATKKGRLGRRAR